MLVLMGRRAVARLPLFVLLYQHHFAHYTLTGLDEQWFGPPNTLLTRDCSACAVTQCLLSARRSERQASQIE
jgi:hypothetical protein